MTSECIRIGIIDDDILFAQLLKDFIDRHPSMEVVLVRSNGNDFLKDFEYSSLDVVILDLRMANGNGVEVMEELIKREVDIRTVVLSSFYRESFIGQMLKLGASAFFPKEIAKEELITVLEKVYHFGHHFSKEQVDVMRKQLSNKLPQFDHPHKDGLTKREIDVLKLLCKQLSTKEIAEKLFISPKTVETHKSNLTVKVGVKNTAGLIIYAIQNKIVKPDELLLLG